MFEKIKDFFKKDETETSEDSQVSNISEMKEEKKSNDKNFKEVLSSVFNKRNRKRWAVGGLSLLAVLGVGAGVYSRNNRQPVIHQKGARTDATWSGWLGYNSGNSSGVIHQGWKDTEIHCDGIRNANGTYSYHIWGSSTTYSGGNTGFSLGLLNDSGVRLYYQNLTYQKTGTTANQSFDFTVGPFANFTNAAFKETLHLYIGGEANIMGSEGGLPNGWNGGGGFAGPGSWKPFYLYDFKFQASVEAYSGYSPSSRQHNVNYNLAEGTWGDKTISNGNVIIPNGIYSVQHLYSKQQGKNYYMHLLGQEDAGVHTWETDTNDNSNWYFERYGDTEYYYIFNKGTGLALSASGQDDIFQQDLSSTGDSTKLWRLKDKGNGAVRIINKNTGKCVFANFRTIKNGNPILQYAAGDEIGTDGTWILNLKDSNAYHKKVEYIHFYVASSTPTRAGYKFSGWNTNQDGSGTSYSSGAAYTYDQSGGSVTLYAQWIPDVQYVDVNGEYEGEKRANIGDFGYITKVNGTSYGDSNHSDYYETHQCGSTVSVTAKTWNGYEFTDGSTEKTITETVPFNNKLEILFKGRRKTYKVYYNSNGGTGTMSEQRIKYKDSFTTNKNDFSKVGYRFIGYNEKADGTGVWWNIPNWNNGAYSPGAAGSDGVYETGKNWTWNYTNDITLYAQWAANDYTINFNANGGKGSVEEIPAKYDSNISLGNGSELSYEGFKFAGWNTKADGTGQQFDVGVTAKNLTTVQDDTVTLYAQWKESFSRDICEANPGMDAQEFEYTDKNYDVDRYNEIEKNLHSATDNIPSEGMHRVGYKIIGWNTDKKKAQDGIVEYKDKAEFINKSKENNSKVNLYAVWQITEQTITYDLNGATEAALVSDTGKVANIIENNTQKYTYRTTTYISSGKSTTGKVITRPGYKFVGWETVPQVKGEKAMRYNPSQKVQCLPTCTLKAVWEINKVTITYDANGGSGTLAANSGSPSIQSFGTTAVQNGNAEAPFTLSSGEGFSSHNNPVSYWNTKRDGSGQTYILSQSININSDLDLYAQYNYNDSKYSLDFDANVPKLSSSKITGKLPDSMLNIPSDKIITIPSAGVNLVGWHNDGKWYKNKVGKGISYSFGTTQKNIGLMEHLTILYLNWTPNTYKVVYEANKPFNASNNVTGTIIGRDLDRNDLTNASMYTYDVSGTLAKNMYALKGWKFTGWNTKADGSGKEYIDRAEIKNLTTKDNEIVHLYAQWKPIQYYVRYNSNGGIGNTTKQQLTYDSANTLNPCTFTREGYHFDNTKTWNTDADMKGDYYNNKQTGVFNFKDSQDGIQDLYVNWIENQYTITYHKNDGSTEKTVSGPFNYTENVTIAGCGFNKTGHEFTYWSTNKDGSGTRYDAGYSYVKLISENGGNLDLYANWKTQKYDLIINPKDTCYTGSSVPTYKGSSSNVIITKGLEYGKDFNHEIGKAQNEGYNLTDYKLSGNDAQTIYDKEGNAVASSYWDIAESGNNLVYSYTGTTDLNVNAHWSPIHYTVTYNPNGGTGTIEDMNCEYDKSYTLSGGQAYNKVGYHLIGWSTDSNKSYKSFNVSDKDSFNLNQGVKNITSADNSVFKLYAVWAPNTYTVKFIGNGTNVSGTMNNQSFTYDEEQNLLKNQYKKPKYLFCGWNTKADGSGLKVNEVNKDNLLYADEEKVLNLTTKNNETVNLYAQWKSATYTITYDPNGGEVEKETPMPDSKMDFDETKACADNNTLRPITYTVNMVQKQYFTKVGYRFIGWNTIKAKADERIVEYGDGARVCNLTDPRKSETIILYAVWTPIEYYIDFDKNLPSNPNEDIDPTLEKNLTGTMKKQFMTYDKLQKLNKNQYDFPNKQYTFEGWSTKADGTGRFFVDEAQAAFNLTPNQGTTVKLYAQWIYNGYRIKFNPNGATGTMKDEVFYVGVSKSLYKNEFKKVGYNFNGWNTQFNGTGKDYSDEQKITQIVYSSEANVAKGVQTLYAQWVPITYTVHFEKNNDNATGKMEDIDLTYDEPKELPKNQYKVPGATFVGWSETPKDEGKTFKDGEEVVNLTSKDKDKITLYAVWDYVPVLSGKDFYLVADKRNSAKGTTVSTDTLITGKNTYQYDKIDENFKDKLKVVNSPMKAVDKEEGDISNKIKVEKIQDKNGNTVKEIDATKPGEYTVTYYATDSFGNKGTGTRKVIILETPAPVINANDRYFYVNSNITKKLLLSRVTATDKFEGLISSRVTIDGYDKFKENSNSFSRVGKYTITYKVSNIWGGKTSKTVNIYIIDTFDTEDRTGDIQYIRKSCSADDDYCLEYLPEDSQWQNKKDELKQSLNDNDSKEDRQIVGNKNHN